MIVTLKLKRSYDVTINGKTVGEFFETSRWHGMVALKNGKHEELIVAPDTTKAWGEIFGLDCDATVVQASPGILGELRAADEPRKDSDAPSERQDELRNEAEAGPAGGD